MDSELATLQEYILIASENKKQKTMNLDQFYDNILLWADVIWTERQEEMNNNIDLDVTDNMLDIRGDFSDDNPPLGEFYEDPVLETLKDQVYK